MMTMTTTNTKSHRLIQEMTLPTSTLESDEEPGATPKKAQLLVFLAPKAKMKDPRDVGSAKL